MVQSRDEAPEIARYEGVYGVEARDRLWNVEGDADSLRRRHPAEVVEEHQQQDDGEPEDRHRRAEERHDSDYVVRQGIPSDRGDYSSGYGHYHGHQEGYYG